MQVIPIASESLGTRGQSIFIMSEDSKILIDPSVSLAPIRNGYYPHILEIAAAYLSRQYIMKFWEIADIIIQTHYHADHYSLGIDRPYEFTNQSIANKLYSNPEKIILAKDSTRNINYNQKRRAFWLWKRRGLPLLVADGNTFVFGRTRIYFSNALPHGRIKSRQGWVVSVVISDSYESILITSDVNGPGSDIALRFIINNPTDLLIVDGPSSYHHRQTIEETKLAFRRLLMASKMGSVIIDHHLLRDSKWKILLENQGISSENITLSSLLGIQPLCLEYKRTQLYTQYPMDPSFHSRFLSHDLLLLEKIKELAKTLPHHSKFERAFKEVLRKSEYQDF